MKVRCIWREPPVGREEFSQVKVQVDIKPNGTIVMEILERSQGENCTAVSHRLVQGMSIESDESIGPECDEVHESSGEASL